MGIEPDVLLEPEPQERHETAGARSPRSYVLQVVAPRVVDADSSTDNTALQLLLQAFLKSKRRRQTRGVEEMMERWKAKTIDQIVVVAGAFFWLARERTISAMLQSLVADCQLELGHWRKGSREKEKRGGQGRGAGAGH